MMRRCRASFQRLPAALLAVMLGAGLFGCAPDFTDRQALTQLRFNGIQDASGGAFPDSIGVVSEIANLVGDDVTVRISNESVSPGVSPDAIYDVILEGYTVSFARSDAGSAVPSQFGTIFTERIRASGFNSPIIQSVTIRILQPEQKVLPPLEDLYSYGYEQSTGFLKIQTVATVHMWGRNRMGDRADLTFQIRVTFCHTCQA